MLGRLFEGKSEFEVLQRQYGRLMHEAKRLASVDLELSQRKQAEAEHVAQRMEVLAIR